jgi:hypothetical protein
VGIIYAGVDDFAVPAGGLLAKLTVFLQHKNTIMHFGELAGNGQTHHSGTYDHDLCIQGILNLKKLL